MSTAEKKQGLDPRCSAQSMIVGSCYRFSLLTARLVRMEYDPDGVFEDIIGRRAIWNAARLRRRKPSPT